MSKAINQILLHYFGMSKTIFILIQTFEYCGKVIVVSCSCYKEPFLWKYIINACVLRNLKWVRGNRADFHWLFDFPSFGVRFLLSEHPYCDVASIVVSSFVLHALSCLRRYVRYPLNWVNAWKCPIKLSEGRVKIVLQSPSTYRNLEIMPFPVTFGIFRRNEATIFIQS